MPKTFRIVWEYTLGPHKGHGEWLTEERVKYPQDLCRFLNRSCPGFIHTVEYKETKEK